MIVLAELEHQMLIPVSKTQLPLPQAKPNYNCLYLALQETWFELENELSVYFISQSR